jgi:chemotaxis protein histidine kinase CheA
MQDMDMVMHFDLEPTSSMDNMNDIQGMPETLSAGVVEGLFQDMDMGEISMQEVMVEVEAMVEEIQNIGMEVETVAIKMPEQEMKVVIDNVESVNEPIEESKIEAPEPQPTEEAKEIVEVADNQMETTPEVKEEIKEESNAEEETTTSDTMEVKEVAKEQTEPQEEEVAEEKPQEKTVAKETDEEKPKETVEEKPTKEQEQKQKKANQIIAGLPNSYDPVSQITTLALVNALGPDISTYQNVAQVVQPTWYVAEDIYTDSVLPDPLGSYISVRSSLQIEKMIAQQYE